MRDLPGKWRIFKAFGILQMIMVTFLLVVSLSGISGGGGSIPWRLFDGICYGIMMLFLYNGFTILNDNYPDTSLSLKQKRSFNILFLLNFLLIAFVFAKVVSHWRLMTIIFEAYSTTTRSTFFVILPFAMAMMVFVLHIVYLAGMYRLRLTIQDNNTRMIDDDFITDD